MSEKADIITVLTTIIQNLIKEDKEWEDKILQYDPEDEDNVNDSSINSKLYALYRDLYRNILSFFKETECYEEEEIRHFIKLYVQSDNLVDKMYNTINMALKSYCKFKPLREMDKRDTESVKNLYSFVFDNDILRCDMNSQDKFKSFNFSTVDEYNNIARMLYVITNYSIYRYLTRSSIISLFREETGLSNDVCDYIAGKIDCNFTELKLNYIIDHLNNE